MTRSGSASKELTYNTSTSFRFHTNFTNPLKITNLATSPTKSNYVQLPQAVAHPSTPASRRSAAGASAPRTPMLLFLRSSNPKLPLVLRLSARAWPTRAEGKQAGFTPSPHLVQNTAHIGANLQSTQHPVDRITGRPLVKITVSLQLLPLMLGKSSNSHFQDSPSKHPTARNSQQCCDT